MMGTATFSAFRRDAVAQITGPGYPVSEVSERLGDRMRGMSPKGKARLKPPPDFCNNALWVDHDAIIIGACKGQAHHSGAAADR